VRGSRPDFFEPLELSGEFPNLGIQFGELFLVFAGLALQILGFGKQKGEVVQGLALPPLQLPRMNALLGGNLRHVLFFFEEF